MRTPAAVWPLSLLWLLALGPLFYLSYGLSNYWASLQPQVMAIQFDWERAIPFMAWTIWPYWSLNLFYAASLFVVAQRWQVHRLGAQLLTAQLIAVSGFMLFPLQCLSVKPEVSGWSGWMFEQLAGFDKPYNQAPSLHIILALILYSLYASKTPNGWPRWLLKFWFGLIGLSVLTSFQHHFIDIPTGIWVGALCLWLWPLTASPMVRLWRWSSDAKAQQLARRYALAGLGLGWLALSLGPGAWLLLWPALALLLVALNYAALGAQALQKNAEGQFSLAVKILYGPYLLGAWLNSRAWPVSAQPLPVAGQVYLGNARLAAASHSMALLDMTAELWAPTKRADYACVPLLDLCVPSLAQLRLAVDRLQQMQAGQPVLLYCALGYSRSVSVAIAWLYATGQIADIESGIERIQALQPRLVLTQAHRQLLQQFAQSLSPAATAGH